MKIFPILTSLFILTSGTLPAAPAEIQMRSGDVAFSQDRLRTAGSRSAAEARLAGDGTLRLAGPGDALTGRTVQVDKGLALLSSGRGVLGRKAITTSVGPLSLSLKGTTLISRLPDQPLKITILEGTATARLADRRSRFMALESGMMLMMSEYEIDLPRPTDVRLSLLRGTSGLMAKPFGPLPAESAILAATAGQEKEIARRRLVASNVRLRGGQASLGETPGSGDDSAGGGDADGSASGGSSSSSGSSTSTSTSSSGTTASAAAGTASAHVCLDCLSHATPTGAVSGNDANRLAQIRADLAASGVTADSTARASSLPGGKPSTTVSVSGSAAAAAGDLGTALTADSVVTVTNSSDLTAFAEAVVLANLGENLTAEGSTFSNRQGGISLDAGTIYQRTLTLRNNTLAADVIKARGFNIPEVTPSSSKAAASTPDNSCASTGRAAVPCASGATSR